VFSIPSLQFALPGGTLTPAANEVGFRIPMSRYGADNSANPGDSITVGYNPIQEQVAFLRGGKDNNIHSESGRTFLFDTGAQLSVISKRMADNLHLDFDNPDFSTEVQGAGGTTDGTIPGFYLESLDLPVFDSQGHATDILEFQKVPVFVLEEVAPGIDGILGMNLWNRASTIMYDPFGSDGNVRLRQPAVLHGFPGTCLNAGQSDANGLPQRLSRACLGNGGQLLPHLPAQPAAGTTSWAWPEPASGLLALLGFLGLIVGCRRFGRGG